MSHAALPMGDKVCLRRTRWPRLISPTLRLQSRAMFLRRWVATWVLLLAVNLAPPPAPTFELQGLTWSWAAPHAQWSASDQAWRSDGASLHVDSRRASGLHWEVHAPAGVTAPLRFRVEGASHGFVRNDGVLVLSAKGRTLTESHLVAFQPRPDGTRRPLVARYEGLQQRLGSFEYALALDDVDASLPVVVDPDVSVNLFNATGDQSVIAVAAGDNDINWLLLLDQGVPQVQCLRGNVVYASFVVPSPSQAVDLVASPDSLFVLTRTTVPHGTLWNGGSADVEVFKLDHDCGLRDVVAFGTSGNESPISIALHHFDTHGPIAPDLLAVVGSTDGNDVFTPVGARPDGAEGFLIVGSVDFTQWSSAVGRFVGGTGDDALSFVSWGADRVWVEGSTSAVDLPVTDGALQPAPRAAEDLVFGSFGPTGDVITLSYFGSDGGDKPAGIVASPSGAVALFGVSSETTPLSHPFSPSGLGFLAVVNQNGTSLVSATRFPSLGPSESALAQNDQVAWAGLGDRGFPMRAPWQAQANGDGEFVAATWNLPSGRLVWSSWAGGAQTESNPRTSVNVDGSRWTFAGDSLSSDFSNHSTQQPDLDVALLKWGETYDGGSGAKTLALGTTGECSAPVLVGGNTDWNKVDRGIAVRSELGDVYEDPECRVPTGGAVSPRTTMYGTLFVKAPRSTQLDLFTALGAPLYRLAVPLDEPARGGPMTLPQGATVSLGSCIEFGDTFGSLVTVFDEFNQFKTEAVYGDQCIDSRNGKSSLFANDYGVRVIQSAGGGVATRTGLVVIGATASPSSLMQVGARRLVSSQCSGAQYVVTLDGTKPVYGTDLTLRLTPTNLKVYSDDLCSKPATELTLTSKDAAARFFVMGGTTGAATLAIAGPVNGQLEWEVVPTQPNHLTFSPPKSLSVGECGRLDIESRDEVGNESAEERTDGDIGLTASGVGAVSFYSDRECRNAVAGRTWRHGLWWVPVWIRGERPGLTTINADAHALTGSVDLTVAGTVVTANALNVNTNPSQVQRGVCSSVSTVQALANNTPVTLSEDIALSSTDPGLQFFADASCTQLITRLTGPIASTGANFFMKTSTPGSRTVTLTSSVSSLQTSFALNAVSGPPSQLLTAPTSLTVVRDNCATVSLQLRDALGFPANGTVNVISSGAVPLTFGTSACGVASSTTLTFTGATLTLFVSGANLGSGVITLTPAGLSATTIPVTITAPPVARWRFKLQPDAGPAVFNALAGACTPVDVEALDLSGRTTTSVAAAPLDGGSPTVFFHSVGDCDGGLVVASSANVPESGARVWVRSTVAQTSQLGVGLAAQTGVAPLTIAAAAPARITAPSTLAFEGRTCATLGPVTVQDLFGNAITSWPTGVSVVGTNTATSSLATDCSGAANPTTLSTFPVTLGVTALTAGSATLQFNSTDGGAPSVTTTLTVGWPAAVGYTLRDAGSELIAGACGNGLLFALDDGGVPTRSSAALPFSADTTSAQLFTNATCAAPTASASSAIDENGAAVGFRETRAGRTTFHFGPIDWPVDVDAGAPTTLAMNPLLVVAKDCLTPVELRVEDAFGNRARTSAVIDVSASGRNGVSVASGALCGTSSSATLLLNGVSSTSLAVSALRAGDAGLHFTSLSFPALDVPVTVVAGANDAPVVTLPSLEVVVDEGDAGRADLSVFDLDWDPISVTWQQLAGTPFPLSTLGPVQVDGDATAALVLVAPANGSITEDLTLEYAVLVGDGLVPHVVDAGVRFRVRDVINELPTAVLDVLDAGPAPYRLSSGQTFSLSAARSHDPNRFDTLQFAWSVDGGLTLDAGTSGPLLTVSAPPVGPSGTRLHFTLDVLDSRGGLDHTSVDVDVSASDTPVITSTPRTLAQRDVPWSYDLDGAPSATARLGADTLLWSLTEAPTGATIDASTGRISWTPTSATGDFVLRATTAWGWTEQRFTVTVLELPRITSTPATSARLLEPWQYDADGNVEGVNVTWWELDPLRHPSNMVIEGSTGHITWTPLLSVDEEVVVIASNALGRVTQTFTVHVGDATMVLIGDTANRQAQRGVGYVYDADGKVDVTPANTPVNLISIIDHDDPTNVTDLDRFRVEGGGQVQWIPTRAGTFDVIVGAGRGTVATTYAFSIHVSEPSNEAPTAVGTATPDNGPSAPFTTHLDGRGSTPAPGRALVLWSWEAGDGTPPHFGAELDVTYAEARGYTPRLEVADDLGNRASTTLHVGVGIDGVFPPEADIVVTAAEVLEQGKSRVSFACDCRDPGGRPLTLSWSFGDGNATTELAPTHVYTHAAQYWVKLVVSNGPLTTEVRRQVEVRDGEKRPPSVQAWAQPVYGKAPLNVKFTSAASDYDGVIVTRQWDFGGGITAMADDTSRRFETPGRYSVSFRGTDDDGLTSEDTVEVVVTGDDGLAPPLFTSRATSRSGTVGVAWLYDEDGRLAARGATRYGAGRERNGVVQGVPEGLTVDAATGQVTWVPKSPGAWPLIFWAENAAGRVYQTDVVVDVPAPPSGCGCSEADAGGVLLLGLLALRRRRRS